jgi:hypothetical protein
MNSVAGRKEFENVSAKVPVKGSEHNIKTAFVRI